MVKEFIAGKVPPYNIEAEQAALGAMLLDAETVSEGIERLRSDDFYKESHRYVFNAIAEIFDRSLPVDLVTLTSYLKDKNLLDEIGGVQYLNDLLDSVPTSANFSHYADIIIEKSTLRKLISAANQILMTAYESGKASDISEILDKAEQIIFEITGRKIGKEFVKVGDMMKDVIKLIDNLYNRKEYVTGIPCGLHQIDELTAGFQNSDFIVIAARPTMGKTSLALNIIEHAAIEKNIPVGLFSLEMSREQIIYRMLGSQAKVNIKNLRTGYISEADWGPLTNSAAIISDAPIFIDDTAALSLMELRAKARRAVSRYNLKMLLIDYLQLINLAGKHENRQQEISFISRSLKALARELTIPVIALSQLSRKVEERKDKKPQLSDLRESGAIEQDADVVLFIHRPLEDEGDDKPIVCELIVAKQRNGPIGTREVLFHKSFTRFTNLEKVDYVPTEVA
ncbi:MAG: replicative DNA helicase [Spirochaetes bacterium]|nr:replicative DNA helicase [Spirochaetota bacterium]